MPKLEEVTKTFLKDFAGKKIYGRHFPRCQQPIKISEFHAIDIKA